LGGFLNAGVDHVAIRPIGDDVYDQLRVFLNEVLPALNAAAADKT
jgi:hypothetical protein